MDATTTVAPVACTLDSESFTARLRRIAKVAERHLLRQQQEGLTLRLHYASEAAAELNEFVALERQCCAFLAFQLKEEQGYVELAISAPPEAGASASVLYARFRGDAPSRPVRSCAGSGCGCTA